MHGQWFNLRGASVAIRAGVCGVRARWVQVLCRGRGGRGVYGVHRLWLQACLLLPPRTNDAPHLHTAGSPLKGSSKRR